jgi:DNA polymerase-3 subunit gamma/tau
LLTGTRGVGKTTIARILAKSLNCATGVTATPCGVCAACVDIDAGRFVDLLELDAASNTGIDNMREILDNARYAPTVGRYKVYLIDEVHMLSKAAFNSMLKTLEEPPEHVKFVLATTDPQKIPVTVLSRVLQFNLKQLPPTLIVERLAAILASEKIASEAPALALLARAAHGSMRDALSLLDQAIAYGGGEVREIAVRAMLGAVDTEYVYRIADALDAADGVALLAEADAMAERSVSFASALDELASLYHRIAIAQTVPAAAESFDDAERVTSLASRMTPEHVQLAYQICVQGRADLALAPDEATGFSMTLLRLLAFEPESRSRTTSDGGAGAPPREERAKRGTPIVEAPAKSSAARPVASSQPDGATSDRTLALPQTPEAWPAFVAGLKLSGIAGQLAAQSAFVRCEGRILTLAVPATHKHLIDPTYADRLRVALEQASGQKLKLAFEVADAAPASLAAQVSRERAEQKAADEAAFRNEPFVRDLVTQFDATVKPDTIKPIS